MDGDGPAALNRRQLLQTLAAAGAALAVESCALPVPQAQRSIALTITCVIRYQIDPFQREAFAKYADNWARIIPRCGGHLVGYFLPHEGTNDVGWGLIAFDSLAAYEAYRARLLADPEAQENLQMAQTKRLILREERNFVKIVASTFGRPPTLAS